jgi:hypothetical protein
MTHQPPVDQRIVDEYFQLISNPKTKDVAWLYGMVATYGLKPEELMGFSWGTDATILISSKKRPIKPLHPQWVILFSLKKKQPRNLQSCWNPLEISLYKAISYQQIRLNITDLLLAYRIRKTNCKPVKRLQASSVFANAF